MLIIFPIFRKICRNCKCKREVHDVKEENNFEQFEILFGDNLKCNDRVKKICKLINLYFFNFNLYLNNSLFYIYPVALDLKDKLDDIFVMKEIQTKDSNSYIKTDNDLMFDWFPSNVPVNLVSDIIIIIIILDNFSIYYKFYRGFFLLGIRILNTTSVRKITNYWKCWCHV